MFKAIRIFILLCILAGVAIHTWQSQRRAADWGTTLWVRIYPINADRTPATAAHIAGLQKQHFSEVAEFIEREARRYGIQSEELLRIDLGPEIFEQPPEIGETPSALDAVLWSLKMRWWVGSVTGSLEDYTPDVRIFVRYHEPLDVRRLDDSVGIRKGMFGIVNAYTNRRYRQSNNVVLAHELLHTLGATDKYTPGSAQPLPPDGLAEPDKRPLYPQRYAEIMGGRIALSATRAEMPDSLRQSVIGPETAREIGLIE